MFLQPPSLYFDKEKTSAVNSNKTVPLKCMWIWPRMGREFKTYSCSWWDERKRKGFSIAVFQNILFSKECMAQSLPVSALNPHLTSADDVDSRWEWPHIHQTLSNFSFSLSLLGLPWSMSTLLYEIWATYNVCQILVRPSSWTFGHSHPQSTFQCHNWPIKSPY